MAFLCVLLACGGGAEDGPLPDEPVDAAPAAPEEPVIPLCEGSPAQTPELCQELRYGIRGYCNFWHACH